jgi:DNA ligase-1
MFSIGYKTTSQQLLIASIALGLTTFPLYATSISTIPIPLAQTYVEAEHSLSTYLVSEKLDGIRAIWTGSKLITRNGNPIHAPDWFTATLPNFALDGELWSGYRNFEALQSTVLTIQPSEHDWRAIQFHIFDRPDTQRPFRQRYQLLQDWFAESIPKNQRHLKLIMQKEISDSAQLQPWLESVIQRGGEGLILRDPNAPSINGRQEQVLKLKRYQDEEARVVGYRPGKGKYTGLTGALIVRDSNNVEFAIGSGLSDALRSAPPALGSVITFRYQNRTQNGIPRFARFMRVREQE